MRKANPEIAAFRGPVSSVIPACAELRSVSASALKRLLPVALGSLAVDLPSGKHRLLE